MKTLFSVLAVSAALALAGCMGGSSPAASSPVMPATQPVNAPPSVPDPGMGM